MSTKTKRMALSRFNIRRLDHIPPSHTRGPNPNPAADRKFAPAAPPKMDEEYLTSLTREQLIPHAEALNMRVKTKTTKKAMIEWITSGGE